MTAIAFTAPAGMIASILIKRTQRFKYLIVIGWALLAAGMASNVSTLRRHSMSNDRPARNQTLGYSQIVQVTMNPDSSKAILYAPRCLAGIGAGILFPAPLFAVQAGQISEDVGIATSVQVFSRSLGTAFGVGLGGVIFQNEWIKTLEKSISDKKIPETMKISTDHIEIGYSIIKRFPKSTREAYTWVFADSLKTVWWVMAALAIVGFLTSLLCRNDEVKGGLSGNQNFQDEKSASTSTREAASDTV